MSEYPSIDNLSPSVPLPETAPHEKWVSEDGVTYYRKSELPCNHLEEDEIYRSIDGDIRVLCFILTKQGCFAMPYHTSRHYDRNQLRYAFNRLKKEEGLIRRKGLQVRSCETGELATFENAQYRMPWGKFDDYVLQMQEEQQTGKVAIFIPAEKGDVCQKLKNNSYDSAFASIEYQKRIKDNEFFLLKIKTENDEEAKVEWKLLTAYMAMVLGFTQEENKDVAIQNV